MVERRAICSGAMVFALLFPSLFPCSARPSPSKVRPRAERCAGRSRIERPRLFPSLLRDDLLRRVSSFFFILSLSLSFTPCRRRFTVRCYYGCGVAVTIRPNPVNPVHSASRAAHWYALVDGGISFDEYALDRGGKKTFLLGFRFFSLLSSSPSTARVETGERTPPPRKIKHQQKNGKLVSMPPFIGDDDDDDDVDGGCGGAGFAPASILEGGAAESNPAAPRIRPAINRIGSIPLVLH